MHLEVVAKTLNLPNPTDIMAPSGIGAQVYADLVKEKIGRVLERKKGVTVRTGILVANPNSADETQHPIAIVCDFAQAVSQDVLSFTHQLAWNFCRAPLLIVIEPTLVRAFSCYKNPLAKELEASAGKTHSRKKRSNAQPSLLSPDNGLFLPPEPITGFEFDENGKVSDSVKSAVASLQWIELISGNFFRKEKRHFPREERADKTLLANLQFIREKLRNEGLENDTIHDLLARLIFIQFLFQREDSEGKTAISPDYLSKLYNEQKLSKQHNDLESILRSYNDAYKFFRILNDRFNGDLFPGSKEAAWQAEKARVSKTHLTTLADFISGKFHQETGQGFLWQIYSFDTIPLEFISSIYEEFVSQDQYAAKRQTKSLSKQRESGVYYTKSHLVDFILDSVLPWDGDTYDLKILDPSCGSGIFLVKAFQRLVRRWKNHQLTKERKNRKLVAVPKPKPRFLSSLLENNLFGVDIDGHAVRVASFSLYLAMCDEIDPRTLWEEAKFPNLRDRQVVERDFFQEDEPLFKESPEIKYDLIVGNAPWGKDTLDESQHARRWAKRNGWETSNKNLGPLFLPRAASLIKDTGVISLVQPALPLLTGQLKTAEKFRQRLFREFKIEEITNLSDLRFVLFEKAVSPPCVITYRAKPPDGEPIVYLCPKKRGTDEDYRQIVIEPMDENLVHSREAIEEPWIWTALMWGSRRDLALINRLRGFRTVDSLDKEKKVRKRRGIYRSGNEGGKKYDEILGRRILEASDFPTGTFLSLDSKYLEKNKNPYISANDTPPWNTFEPSQAFLKLTWTLESWRFHAAYVQNSTSKGVLCTSGFYNIQSSDIGILKSVVLTYNSTFATYYLLLTNGRFAFYIPEPSGSSFWQVPIPQISEKRFESLEKKGELNTQTGLQALDRTVFEAFSLSESERILIDDLFNVTLPDFKKGEDSAGRQTTSRKTEIELKEYCSTFIRVIKAGFGQGRRLSATIFQEDGSRHLPVRMIAIYFDTEDVDGTLEISKSNEELLWERLEKLNENMLRNESSTGNIFVQRVARLYERTDQGGISVPTVYLVKPDQRRYWLKSRALDDAEQVSADIVHWFREEQARSVEGKKKKVA